MNDLNSNNIQTNFERKKLFGILFFCSFLILIFLPLLSSVFKITPENANDEQRQSAKAPFFNINNISTYPKHFESYYNDNFPFRSLLIKYNHWFKVKCLNTSPLPKKVILGKDNWLFYPACIYDSLSMNEFFGNSPWEEQTLQKIEKNIQEQHHWLSKKGIEYIILICPNKQTIYPENLPEGYFNLKGNSRLDQLMEYLKKETREVVIDLRTEFSEIKTKIHQPLYYKTDTHWNELGAFIAWNNIIDKLSRYPQGYSQNMVENIKFVNKVGSKEGGDIARMLSLQDFYKEDILSIKPKLQENKKYKKLVIFSDSYYDALEPFIRNTFDSIINRPFFEAGFNVDLIEQEKPDVVIFEMVERYKEVLINDNDKRLIQK